MALNLSRTRELLQSFEFGKLFIEELGWSNPAAAKPVHEETKGASFQRKQVAQLAGVAVFEVSTEGLIPDGKMRAAISKEISKLHHENLLIFVDSERTQSLWYWVKREEAKVYPRDHLYVKGQPGDLFLSKLASMVVDMSELDAEGNIGILEVAHRLKEALDIERVTKRFYKEFQQEQLNFLAPYRWHRRRAPAPLVCLGAAKPADVYLLPSAKVFPRLEATPVTCRRN
jgi:hypothetical protein